jgi:multidrug resistance efflux pump
MRTPLVIALVAAAAAAVWFQSRREAESRTVSGTLEADEVRVASRSGGRVLNLHAAEGDVLAPGQPVAELDAAELRARRDEAAALLEELEHGPRPQEIEAARLAWEALAAETDFARAEARRKEDLYAQKVVSDTDRDSAVARARSLERQTAAAREQHALLAAGTRPERIAQARARVAEFDALLRESRVESPCDCILETLHVRPGDVLPPNGAVATLVYRQAPWVRVYVPAPWLGHIRTGQEAEVRVDSFPGRAFTSVVEQVSRKAEFTPRNVQTVDERIRQVFGVKLRLRDADGVLRPGMAADVEFPGVEGEGS